nr:SirB2 family protein [Methylomarinum sp. Ch1-1]MDP4522185.1 SirB2 family protein [Methylomarinum sp. Ch1-1]
MQFNAELLQRKLFKIAPHIIDTLLLLSGIALVFQGNWLAGEYGWIISKLIVLVLYIAFAIMTMRSSGNKRWLAFAAAVASFILIFVIAITKQGFI